MLDYRYRPLKEPPPLNKPPGILSTDFTQDLPYLVYSYSSLVPTQSKITADIGTNLAEML